MLGDFCIFALDCFGYLSLFSMMFCLLVSVLLPTKGLSLVCVFDL